MMVILRGMIEMKPLPIDLDDLILALEEHNPGARNYLDRETGEIIFASNADPDNEEEDGDIPPDLDSQPDRYLLIKPVPPTVSLQVMEFFLRTIPPQVMEFFLRTIPQGRMSASLAEALRQEHPLRRFKEVLSNDYEMNRRWHTHHRQQFTRIAQKWLEAKGLQAHGTGRESWEDKLVERNIQNKLGKLMDNAWVPPLPGG
jgi:hypothetical protein